MPIGHLVWACVVCGREAALKRTGKFEVCTQCGARYTRARGAEIRVTLPDGGESLYAPRQLAERLPAISLTGVARCDVREWLRDEPLHQFGRYLGRFEILGEARPGTLSLSAEKLSFEPDQGEGFELPLEDITAIQPSSGTLQIKGRKRPVFSVRFHESSPRLWEEKLQHALDAAYARGQLGEIAEYQPRVTISRVSEHGLGPDRVRTRIRAARNLRPGRPWQYRLASWVARNVWRLLGGGISVHGLENIPPIGPFLVLANHESYLETMLVPAVMPRAAHMMAKSTQFSSRITGWLMPRLFAYPVRRFEIDPQAIRYTVRRMAEGYGIVIFLEGERTWDGELQAARLGTVRLAMSAGVPVIPCRVEGAYAAWPRWASRTQRSRITINFGKPIEMPDARTRAERESNLETAVARVRSAIGPRPASSDVV